MNNVIKELNTKMNFSYITETISNVAYDMTKELRVKENRYNENALLKEDFKFESENFLYDIKKYPEVKLEQSLLKNESIILSKFNKKEIYIENSKVEFYTLKENEDFILYEDFITHEAVFRYTNNFIKEKSEVILSEKTDLRKEEVSKFLLKENACAEIESLNKLFERATIDLIAPENVILRENCILYATKNYEDLKAFKPDCEIAYNEVINEGKIIPILTFIDILSEEVEGIYSIDCKESYKNHYNYNLNKIYEA